MYCDFCGGTMLNTGRAGKRWRWECDECGQVAKLVYPPYVFIARQADNQVSCAACGETYDWKVPVPLALFVGGNNAFAWAHYGCGERWTDARSLLLAALNGRMVRRALAAKGYE